MDFKKINAEKLIELIQKFPVLYDQSNANYKNIDLKHKVWTKIAEMLKIKEGPEVCKRKWFHIRDQMRKTLKKRKAASAQSIIYRRQYKYEELLQFIIPHFTELEAVNVSYTGECKWYQEEPAFNENQNIKEETIDNEESISTEEGSTKEKIVETRNEIKNCENQENSLEITEGKRQSSEPSSEIYSPSPVKKRKTNKSKILKPSRKKSEASSTFTAVEILMNEKSKKPNFEAVDKIHVDAFLAGIAPSLKLLNPLLFHQAKNQIFAIVQEFELQQITDNQEMYLYQNSQKHDSSTSSSSSSSSSSTSSPIPGVSYCVKD